MQLETLQRTEYRNGPDRQPCQAAKNDSNLGAMHQVGLLQHIGLVQPLHGGIASGETMDVAFIDAGEQQIVHGLLRRFQVRQNEVQSVSHCGLLLRGKGVVEHPSHI